MVATKIATLILRIAPALKEALRTAAQREYRSSPTWWRVDPRRLREQRYPHRRADK